VRAPHLKAFIEPKRKFALCRLRLNSFPLRVCTGKFEKVKGSKKKDERLPRHLRLCRVCGQDMVEDIKHFLFGCSVYEEVKAKFPAVFAYSCPADVFNHHDQCELAHALYDMLQHRHMCLS
jgi:hypothetical protein